MMITRISRRALLGRVLVAAAALALVVGLPGCDKVDPTAVENPATTDEDLAQAEEPVKALLPGLRAQFGRMIGAAVTTTAVVSDNYSIHGTGILKTLDRPRTIDPGEVNSTTAGSAHSIYWNIQEMRALADFVIDDIAPDDETATVDDLAESRYYRGMALLMLSENFSAAPVEEDGTPLPAAQILDLAIADLEQATSGEFAVQAQAALARAYRWKGDASSARSAAQAALSSGGDFVFMQEYDATSVTNNPWAFVTFRQLQEMQPLPRLDFLDPKYLTRESGIPVAKAEEMHLILAEADLAGGSEASGRTHLVQAIELALSRATTTFSDIDPRANEDLSIRPRDAVIRVAADPSSPLREGLVLDRPDVPVEVPTISGTSLNPDSVETLTGDGLWHAFHLARQEILFLEARRMADLGIKLPIMRREIDTNPNVSDGDPGTSAVVPSWIPEGDEMDLFDPKTLYEGALTDEQQVLMGDETVCRVDMNRLLVQNMRTVF